MAFLDILRQSLTAFWTELARFAPRVIAVFIILLAGWVLARLVKFGITFLLSRIHFSQLAEKSGIDTFLKEGGVQNNLQGLLAGLGYWLVVLLALLAAANSLGLSAFSQLLSRIAIYVPNVLAAVLILLFGALLARFIGGVVLAFARNMGFGQPETLGTIATWALMVFAALVAVEQLKIGMEILASTFQIAFGAICLALAIAFGLGGRDWAADLLGRMQRKLDGPPEARPSK